MRIRMFKFYRTSCTVFAILGILVIAGSLIFTVHYYCGTGIDDFIMLIICIPLGAFITTFPIILNYRHLTSVILKENKYTSYTLFRKKLCQVDCNEEVYSCYFNVCFLFSPPVKFIAISNAPFSCAKDVKSNDSNRFFGTYDQTRIIIFPFDETIANKQPNHQLHRW